MTNTDDALASMPSSPQRAPIIWFVTADVVSDVGNVLTVMAIPWLVLHTTGSAAQAGLAVAAGTIPMMVGGIFGGVIVDRLGAKRASITADLASAVFIAAIPLLDQTRGLAFWQLLLLVFLGALLDTPGRTARQSLTPRLARLAGYRLDRLNAAKMLAGRLALLLTPPLTGLLITLVGTTNVLWINTASFLISAGIFAVAVPGRAASAEVTPNLAEAGGYLEELRIGLRFIRRNRVVFAVALTWVLASLVADPIYGLILPVYANEIFGDAVALGLMLSALAAGSILGNVLFLALASRVPRRPAIVVAYTVRAITFWALVPLPPLPVVTGSIIVNATLLEPTNPIMVTALQEQVPEHLRGRVHGTLYSLTSGARSLGLIAYGVLLQELGLSMTLLLLALVNLILPLIVAWAPGFRELDAPPRSAPG